MTKKIVPILLFLLSFSLCLSADWRSDVSAFFAKRNDYQGAIDYLLSRWESIDATDKPVVSGLLAYSFNRLNDKSNEYEWLGQYFETSVGYGIGFDFLDESNHEGVIQYIRKWQSKYPLVTEIGFIKSSASVLSALQAKLVIGIEIANNALYKLSDEKNILKGGLFLRGFNSTSVEAKNLFEKSGTHSYFLELKADDFIVKKEIEIQIQLESQAEVKREESEAKYHEYLLSMFVGDELIASSKKSYSTPLPLKIEVPPGKGRYAPYGPVDPGEKSDPLANSASILDAVAGIYDLVKQLKAKKGTDERIPPVEKKQQITVVLKRKNREGIEQEFKAHLTLRAKNIKFFPL